MRSHRPPPPSAVLTQSTGRGNNSGVGRSCYLRQCFSLGEQQQYSFCLPKLLTSGIPLPMSPLSAICTCSVCWPLPLFVGGTRMSLGLFVYCLCRWTSLLLFFFAEEEEDAHTLPNYLFACGPFLEFFFFFNTDCVSLT